MGRTVGTMNSTTSLRLRLPVASSRDLSTPQLLFQEWYHLTQQPGVRRRVARWDLPGGQALDLDEVLRRAGFEGSPVDDEADRVLHRLVVLARQGDDLAGRVVLQRILPGLVAMARRRAPWSGLGHGAAFDEVAGAAWLVIRTFPAERRTQRLAANLLRDIEYQAFVRPRRLRWSVVELPVSEFTEPAGPSDDDPAVVVTDDARRRLLELLDQARRAGLADADLQLAEALGRGETVLEVSRRLGVSDRAVRSRRATVIRRLQAVAAA